MSMCAPISVYSQLHTKSLHIRLGIGVSEMGLRSLRAGVFDTFGMGVVKAVFQSIGHLLCLREVLTMEQKGVANSYANSW